MVEGLRKDRADGAGVFRHRFHSKKLAVKCLFPGFITDERRKRFKNEVDFCSRQRHPNVIQVVDFGLVTWDSKKTPFYVMPFYVMPFFAMTLRVLMTKGIPQSNVLSLFSQMLDGVEAAHLLGVIHRDLKPENFLHDPEKNVLVTADFGIAHFQEDQLATAVETKATAKMANLGYAAPEQRMRGTEIDHRADIYALGLMLNEMFTALVPHGAGYKTIGAVAANYSYLDPIVERTIQQSAGARFPRLEEVKKELIGRQNEFVALQQLDSKKREVVRANEPQRVAPVQLIGADWDGGRLTLTLDRAPESGWVRQFRNPRESYSSVWGAAPEMFQFSGNQASVGAKEDVAQQVINHFKTYADMATRGYQQELIAVEAKREREERSRLEQEVAAAEARKRVLEKLKI